MQFDKVDATVGTSRRRRRKLRAIECLALATLLASGTANGQERSTLRGRVVDAASSLAVVGAEVTHERSGASTTTDSAGQFNVRGVQLGQVVLLVRRVGYEPLRAVVEFRSDTSPAELRMSRTAYRLPGVNVRDSVRILPKLSLFEEHRRLGFGRFLTQDVFEKDANRQVSEILARVPGARIIRGSSNAAWVGSSRGPRSFERGSYTPTEADRMRGAGKACYASVMLDGVVVFHAQSGEPLFDVNMLSPSSIAGIEFYAGAASTPMKYRGVSNDCGLIVIWTR
jgi:hypothetical protein